MSKYLRTFVLIVIMTIFSTLIALPKELPLHFSFAGKTLDYTLKRPILNIDFMGIKINRDFELKQGLDIQGGIQVVLRAHTEQVPEADRASALESAREIIHRRVDMFGVSEPVVQTSQASGEDRIIVELAGVTDPAQALALIGQTAQLEFKLYQPATDSASLLTQTATDSASASAQLNVETLLKDYKPTGLTGKQLRRSEVQFDQQTGEPVVGIEFNDEGRELFAEITRNNTGKVLAIFLDDFPIMQPVIQTVIVDGRAIISGGFPIEYANQLRVQLNAGALPIPIEVIEQRSIGASLGQQSVQMSVRAGAIGLALVIVFMIMYYGWKGVIASMALYIYAVLTIAIYKILGVTLTLPGIAGMLLSIGMAVDSNILIFERMKEELRLGRSFGQAMELGFGRAWDSIKDANVATICTALILINPLDFGFLNTSGLVRGFGVTLLIGVLISLFTGIVVTRTFMRLFVKGNEE